MKRTIVSLSALMGCVLSVSTASAAGFFAGNRGAHATGRAGAFTAKADDLSAVLYNPAGLAGLNGTLIQGTDRLSFNRQSFSRADTADTGSGTVPAPLLTFKPATSQGLQVLDPLLGVGTNFGLRGFGVALAVYAPPGSSSADFPVAGGSRYMLVSRQVLMLNYALSAAYRFFETFGVGVSLQAIVMPKLKYQLVVNGDPRPAVASPVVSPTDMLATLEASDMFTPNATIGAWLRPAPFLELGASAQVIPTEIVAKGKLSVTPISPGSTVELSRTDPTTGAPLTPELDLTLPLPVTVRAGARYIQRTGAREAFDIEIDVVYERWSRVQQIHVLTHGLEASYSRGAPLPIPDINLNKHWKDTLTVALGGDFNLIPETFTVRGGVAYDTAVASPAYTSVDFASGAQLGLGLGASARLGGLELSAGFEYRVMQTVNVSEQAGRVFQQTPNGTCQPPYTDPNTCHAALIAGQKPAPTVNAGSFDASTLGATLEVAFRF